MSVKFGIADGTITGRVGNTLGRGKVRTYRIDGDRLVPTGKSVDVLNADIEAVASTAMVQLAALPDGRHVVSHAEVET
jgi:hypothetical protein